MNELTPDEHRILVDAIHDSATVIHKGQRMNERIIKPIAIRCGFAYDGDDGADDESLRKFAELIVKECMEWCDAHATIDGSAQQVRNSIKNYFGVEE